MARWSRRRWIVVAAAAVVAAIGGAYGVFALVTGGGPPPVSLAPLSSSPGDGAAPGGAAPAGSLEGTWTLANPESFVGYRVREKLASLPAPSDAVGRTTAVEGSLEISGLRISSVDVTADLTQLTSDESMRDERIHTLGPETDRFPRAEFALSSPIEFDSPPAEGTTVHATAEGTLTLHGVTNTVSVPVQARWSGGAIEVVGRLDIVFTDYGVVAPNFGFVSVEDHGTIEFQLRFVRA